MGRLNDMFAPRIATRVTETRRRLSDAGADVDPAVANSPECVRVAGGSASSRCPLIIGRGTSWPVPFDVVHFHGLGPSLGNIDSELPETRTSYPNELALMATEGQLGASV